MASRTAAVLRGRDVRLFVASRFCSTAAVALLRATFAWQVFAITGSAFHLGLIGLVQFAPVLALGLVAGAVADSADRRRVVMAAQAAVLAGSVALAVASRGGEASLALVYAMVFALASAASFENPSGAALLPTLVPRELFPAATTVNSTFRNLARAGGPVAMGFAIDARGVAAAYDLAALLLAASLLLLARVRSRANPADRRAVSVGAIREGITFVRGHRVLLASMSLDMFAVIFAGATALLPIYADEILGVGPRGYGLLSAALEIGTLLMGAALLLAPPIVRPGRALLAAVGVFGVATIAFGLSRSFPLSMAAFVIAGMADQISIVARSTILQLATPDALRGRVSSVNLVFIGASNQLGAVESGFLAALTSATFSVVFGGIACLGVLAVVALRVPGLRHYRIDRPERDL